MQMLDMKSRPTVIVQRYEADAHRRTTSNSYRELRIHALPGLHERVGDLCSQHIPANGRVLDLAAGSGAMSLRLKDLGFSPTAVDYVASNFKAVDIPFRQLDLNADFSTLLAADGPFDGVVASEIIEHLENPYHFVRECSALLKQGGKLVLSTPNPQHSASIASFLRGGEFLWFSTADRAGQGHISPLTPWQIRFAIDSAGLQLDWEGGFGDGHSRLGGSPRLGILAHILDYLSGVPRRLRGEIYISLATKR